jgi:hypothetical protein
MRLYDEITMSSSNEMASLQTSIILNIWIDWYHFHIK